MSTTPTSKTSPPTPPTQPNEFNNIHVEKSGGIGTTSASEDAFRKNLSLGAPGNRPQGGHFLTRGGVQVTAQVEPLLFHNAGGRIGAASASSPAGSSARAIDDLVERLDSQRGVLLSSSYEFPGRYARWSLGFVNPPLEVSGRGQDCVIRALNERGRVLLPAIVRVMEELRGEGTLVDVVVGMEDGGVMEKVEVVVAPPSEVGTFDEEERSRQPSLFSVVRALVDLFGYKEGDGQLGLYGAFGYDLTFQFEPITQFQHRNPTQRDILLYLPDEIVVVDQDKRDAWTIRYDFCVDNQCTQGIPRNQGDVSPFQPYNDATNTEFEPRDTPVGAFTNSVLKAKEEFKVGNLFETVLSQTFREKLDESTPPSTLFRRLSARNPSPYGFLINLGDAEYLVGASPEMFVRCETTTTTNDNDTTTNTQQPQHGALRVETCPISGTVARGSDALEDAKRIRSLLMNRKEESELTMCTDVDRNDKSRICEPGSVKVIGRRQIEMYSRLIHTVDHVEGYLRKGFDALDAFLCHTWAVTVTGAPKTWAIQFVEENERSARCWYGGAVGLVGFDGSLNTGLTLRTVRIKDGVAEVRAGATLLYDSDPKAEEEETELKASAMLDAIVRKDDDVLVNAADVDGANTEKGEVLEKQKKIILIDHEDSFVHTLGNYLRQTGAEVKTLRSGPKALATIEKMVEDGESPDMVVLSPGPGNPDDFDLSTEIDLLIRHSIPGFGVCLGLQGMVQHFGGELGVLDYPMHGKPSFVKLTTAGKVEDGIFAGLPDTIEVARYHSLYGIRDRIPDCLEITALTTEEGDDDDNGIVMGIRHKTLPFAAVQFHPESILTSPVHGKRILSNALTFLKYDDANEGGTERSPERQHDDSGSSNVPPSTATVTTSATEEFENVSVAQLKDRLKTVGLGCGGSKIDLSTKLSLWKDTCEKARSGELNVDELSVPELRELKRTLGLKGTATNKSMLRSVLKECLGVGM